MRTAKEIDFNSIAFRMDDFPPGELAYTCPEIILALDALQSRVDTKLSIWPHAGACARSDGNKASRHYAVGRLSDAVDFYCRKDPEMVWAAMLDMPFGGIGLDTRDAKRRQPYWRFHADLSPNRAYWVVNKYSKNKPESRVYLSHRFRREFFRSLFRGFNL